MLRTAAHGQPLASHRLAQSGTSSRTGRRTPRRAGSSCWRGTPPARRPRSSSCRLQERQPVDDPAEAERDDQHHEPGEDLREPGSSPNAWTDCTTPERVMNVPKVVRKNVVMTSVTFHTRSIRAALDHHRGRKAVARTTAAGPRSRPGPSPRNRPSPALHAQSMPRVRPNVRNNQPIIVHRRTARSQASSRCPVMSAAMPKAYGMVIATNPV